MKLAPLVTAATAAGWAMILGSSALLSLLDEAHPHRAGLLFLLAAGATVLLIVLSSVRLTARVRLRSAAAVVVADALTFLPIALWSARQPVSVHRMPVDSRANRREARRGRAEEIFGPNAKAALDLLELVEFAWHDCYGAVSPPGDVVEDILVVSEGRLDRLATAARLAVEDFRDLRLQANAVRM